MKYLSVFTYSTLVYSNNKKNTETQLLQTRSNKLTNSLTVHEDLRKWTTSQNNLAPNLYGSNKKREKMSGSHVEPDHSISGSIKQTHGVKKSAKQSYPTKNRSNHHHEFSKKLAKNNRATLRHDVNHIVERELLPSQIKRNAQKHTLPNDPNSLTKNQKKMFKLENQSKQHRTFLDEFTKRNLRIQPTSLSKIGGIRRLQVQPDADLLLSTAKTGDRKNLEALVATLIERQPDIPDFRFYDIIVSLDNNTNTTYEMMIELDDKLNCNGVYSPCGRIQEGIWRRMPKSALPERIDRFSDDFPRYKKSLLYVLAGALQNDNLSFENMETVYTTYYDRWEESDRELFIANLILKAQSAKEVTIALQDFNKDLVSDVTIGENLARSKYATFEQLHVVYDAIKLNLAKKEKPLGDYFPEVMLRSLAKRINSEQDYTLFKEEFQSILEVDREKPLWSLLYISENLMDNSVVSYTQLQEMADLIAKKDPDSSILDILAHGVVKKFDESAKANVDTDALNKQISFLEKNQSKFSAKQFLSMLQAISDNSVSTYPQNKRLLQFILDLEKNPMDVTQRPLLKEKETMLKEKLSNFLSIQAVTGKNVDAIAMVISRLIRDQSFYTPTQIGQIVGSVYSNPNSSFEQEISLYKALDFEKDSTKREAMRLTQLRNKFSEKVELKFKRASSEKEVGACLEDFLTSLAYFDSQNAEHILIGFIRNPFTTYDQAKSLYIRMREKEGYKENEDLQMGCQLLLQKMSEKLNDKVCAATNSSQIQLAIQEYISDQSYFTPQEENSFLNTLLKNVHTDFSTIFSVYSHLSSDTGNKERQAIQSFLKQRSIQEIKDITVKETDKQLAFSLLGVAAPKIEPNELIEIKPRMGGQYDITINMSELDHQFGKTLQLMIRDLGLDIQEEMTLTYHGNWERNKAILWLCFCLCLMAVLVKKASSGVGEYEVFKELQDSHGQELDNQPDALIGLLKKNQKTLGDLSYLAQFLYLKNNPSELSDEDVDSLNCIMRFVFNRCFKPSYLNPKEKVDINIELEEF